MSTIDQIKEAPLARVRVRFRPPRASLAAFVLLLVGLSVLVIGAFVHAVDRWTWAVWAILPLMTANALWISGGAATALLGLFAAPHRSNGPCPGWTPQSQTAVLITVCGEDPDRVAPFLRDLSAGLRRAGLETQTRLFVLSDTFDPAACQREDAALRGLIASDAITFRRRHQRTNKKPGNIADWLDQYGRLFDHMVVLDADSRMSAPRIRQLIWRLEGDPGLGLCQAGISLVPGRTRFGTYQRLTARLLSKTFGQGFASWSGGTGNYWGHNAIIRVEAFRAAATLPTLSGPPPFGGLILSHDFIEAAWIRRAGWRVALCPDLRGSAEDAPQTLDAYFKRDRRWCQGNLQHLRLISEPGLHPISRYHLLTGIFSYLAAPIWLVLLMLLGSGLVSVWGVLPVASVAAVLLVPKLCALIEALPRMRTAQRKAVVLRAWATELGASTWLAPLVMLRQAYHVGVILLGRDCGWKSAQDPRPWLPAGWAEAACGLALFAFAAATGGTGTFWMALVGVPLLSAPIVVPRLNGAAR